MTIEKILQGKLFLRNKANFCRLGPLSQAFQAQDKRLAHNGISRRRSMSACRSVFLAICFVVISGPGAVIAVAQQPLPEEGNYILRDFRFRSGETLSELRLHYRTFGAPAHDAQGRVTNAVLVLHGTGSTGARFLTPDFAGALFGPGQLLDARRYFIVIPDNVGHGGSSKPSDGLRMRFPQFEYDDAVALQYRLLTDHLGVNHLRLIIGTSMGCMHSWLWGVTYPDFVDALVPLACLPTEVSGLNRMRRKMMLDVIRNDPEWNGGNYAGQPRAGLRAAIYLSLLVTQSQLQMQKDYPDPRGRRPVPGRVYRARNDAPRRQRHAVRGQCLAELQSFARPPQDHGAGPLHQFRRRHHQSGRNWKSPSAKSRRSGTAASSCCQPATGRAGMAHTDTPLFGKSIWRSC